MHQRVTAVLVARSGAEHLQRTLDALSAQTRKPDEIVVIGIQSDDATVAAVTGFGPTHFLATDERLSFPAAVQAALKAVQPAASENEWLWLLAQDTAPEPHALERLLAVVEVSPSVAVAGPKLVDWDDRAYLREFGVTMTRFGATVPLVEEELDQAQHDGQSDVLGVGAAAVLVRHSVYTALGGLDLGLPVVDGGLDLSVRARLAGHRVVVAPPARVALADDGIASPQRIGRFGATRRLFRERRAAQLHRRLAYAPGLALVLHWLSLVPLAIVRSLGWLLAKQPGAIGGELAAAFATAFGAGHLGAARRNVRRSKVVGWGAIAPLRMPTAEVRRQRAMQREMALTQARGERRDIDFFAGGGAWILLGTLAANLAAFAAVLGADGIGGGGLLPLPQTVSALWSGVGYGWRELGLGFEGPSDPFHLVLAILGSLTFWQPPFALLLLWLVAMPLAALGAWLLATRLTSRAGLRAVFALAWAFAPPLLTALHDGRPNAVLAHLLLPWLVLAALGARRSWAASGAASILAAAVVACTPSLAPALAVAWLVWLATSGRWTARVIGVPIPALVLFAPLALAQLHRGTPLALFADPGLPLASSRPSAWQLLLGMPGGDTPWTDVAALLHLPAGAVPLLPAVLLAPIAALAIAALFFPTALRAAAALFGGLLGLATAIVASGVAVATDGTRPVAVWSGAGLSLLWLGVTAAAVLGLSGLRRAAAVPAWVAIVALIAAVAPFGAAAALGDSAVVGHATGTLPAYVAAEALRDPRVATLVLAPRSDGALTAEVRRGDGVTLVDQSTLAATGGAPAAGRDDVATLAGNLASPSGLDPTALLKKYGIAFVYLSGSTHPDPAAQALLTRASVALDADSVFARVGTTSNGTLWSVAKTPAMVRQPVLAHPGWQRTVLISLIVVFGFALLLSIPTGRIGEAERRAQRHAVRQAARSAAASGSDPDGAAAAMALAPVPFDDDPIPDDAITAAEDELEPPASTFDPYDPYGGFDEEDGDADDTVIVSRAAAVAVAPDATPADGAVSDGAASGAPAGAGDGSAPDREEAR